MNLLSYEPLFSQCIYKLVPFRSIPTHEHIVNMFHHLNEYYKTAVASGPSYTTWRSYHNNAHISDVLDMMSKRGDLG